MHENSRVLLSLRLLPFTDLHERTYISCFFSHIWRDSGCFLFFPLQVCAGNWRAADRN